MQSKQPDKPKPRYREAQIAEVKALYSPRIVEECKQTFRIRPFNRTESPILFEIPKILPVDSRGFIIDPTMAIVDSEQFLCHELGIMHMNPIYVHIGHLIEYGWNAYGMRLDEFNTADTMRLEIHYTNPPAWGNHHQSLDLWNHYDEVLLHDVQILNGIHWIDFWLIQINAKLCRFRDHCADIINQRLIQP